MFDSDFLFPLQVVSDAPYPHLVPEIMALVPDVQVVLTLRDPMEWAKSRVRHHVASPVCRCHCLVPLPILLTCLKA